MKNNTWVFDSLLTQEDEIILNELCKWKKRFIGTRGDSKKNIIIGFEKDNTLSSIILSLRDKSIEERIQEAIKILLAVAVPDSLLRLDTDFDKDELLSTLFL